MSTSTSLRLLAILAVAFFALALAVGPVGPAGAQEASPPPVESPAPKEKRTPPAPSLPKTPAERDRILSDLYAQLATADDENSAKGFADKIERVWLYSGSATVDLLFGRAMQAISQKKYDLALTFIDHVVEQAPDFTEGWSRRAFVHFQRNQVGLALGDLRRALALYPNHFKALDGLSQVLRDIGENKAALAVLRRLYEVHPHWAGAAQAIEELTRAVEGQGI
jgi:tetratricopeptide (TPR) repeat protein